MSMVEKVARAICYSQFRSEKEHGDARCCQAGGVGGCCVKEMFDDARAAIEAMEPDADMLAEVHMLGYGPPAKTAAIWRALRDSALMEPVSPVPQERRSDPATPR
jgi:hypothetical protein